MALIIKGDMPTGKGCDGCEFQTSRCEQMDACTCYLFGGVIHNFHNERHKDCPIIGEIPDEHGDLKDANAILRWLNSKADNRVPVTLGEIIDFIEKQPIVLEASI